MKLRDYQAKGAEMSFKIGEKAVVTSHDDTWTCADKRSIHIGDTVVITDIIGNAVSIRSRKNNRKVFSVNPATFKKQRGEP